MNVASSVTGTPVILIIIIKVSHSWLSRTGFCNMMVDYVVVVVIPCFSVVVFLKKYCHG